MVVVALVVGLLSAGCTANPASDSARQLAEQINQGLNDRARIHTDGWDAARYALSKSHDRVTVQVLSASGQLRRPGLPPYDTPAPEGRGSLLLRIKVEDEPHSDWTTQTHYYSATHCFQYSLRRWGVEDMDEIDCPPARPIIVPTEPSAPHLMPGSDRALELALKGFTGQGALDPAEVLAEARRAVGQPAEYEVAESHGWVGIAVKTNGNCLLGRVNQKAVEVWIPRPVTIQPGELPCAAMTAADGLAQQHPN
jgi:hypothetical protein